MEGFLTLEWAVFWTLLCVPFLILGIRAMRKLFSEHPEKKLSVALSGAFIVILSSLKVPSLGGSSSHPTGTGISAILSGPWITSVICTIVLLFQGMFMAHGGFTTLGANVFSMGIAGPFVAFVVYKAMRSRNVNASATVFVTAFVADMVTYVVTALQLTLVAVTAGGSPFMTTFFEFLGVFALFQVPIAVAEGFLIMLFFKYLADARPELVEDVGYDTSVRQVRGILDDRDEKKNRLMLLSFAAVLAAMIAFVYIAVVFFDLTGTDDIGAEKFENFIPDFELLSRNLIEIGEFGITILFVVQLLIGIAILAYVWHRFIRRSDART